MSNRLCTLIVLTFGLAAWLSPASANSTLQVTGNACHVNPDFKTAPPVSMFLGRLSVENFDGDVLHQEENVDLTRSGKNPSNCLVDFDIHFTDELLAALVSEDLFVVVEACGRVPRSKDDDSDSDSDSDRKSGKPFQPSRSDTCMFDDDAVVIVDEAVDTLLDDVVAFLLATFEIECPDGSALKRLDPDGMPGPRFICTDEFALDTELAAEVAAREAADAALAADLASEAAARQAADAAEQTARQAADDALAAALAAEEQARINADAAEQSARSSADGNLQSQISSNDTDIAILQGASRNCPPGQFLAQIDLGGTPILVCRPETVHSLQVVNVSANSSCSCTPQASAQVTCCKVLGIEDPFGCLSFDGGIEFTASNCGTTNANVNGSGSCLAFAQTATCAAGAVRTGCDVGFASGSSSCAGSPTTLTCSGNVSFSINCNCSNAIGTCGTRCDRTGFGNTQARTTLSSRAQCLSII